MARTSPLIAFFTIALLVASTFAYRTTVTTVEIDDERTERCRQGRERLRSCEQYLRQQRQRLDNALEMPGMEENQRQEFEQCCRQLREVDEQCRCEMLRDIVRETQQQGREQEGRQMLQKAMNLPSMCGLRPQRCQF